jgi:hypothetical protein
MAIKAYLFVDEECGRRCDIAREKLQAYLDTGEVEEMDIREGLTKFNLGDPAGVPFIGIIAESTGECISQVYIPTEEAEKGATEEGQ